MEHGSTFEALLAALPRNTRKEQGESFEYLTRYALAASIDFGHDIERIERVEEWGVRALGKSVPDRGVDLIVTTKSGELWAVQCKDQKASITFSHLSEFVFGAGALPAKVTRMLYATTSPGLTRNAAKTNFDSGADVKVLDRTWFAEAVDQYPESYRDLLTAVKGKVKVAAPLPLRRPQRAALHAVTKTFRAGHDACQIHWATGTGKTVLAFGIGQEIGATFVLFAVPTLGLISQSIRSARRQYGAGGMIPLVVASDKTTAKADPDDLKIADSEISADVIHNAEALAARVSELESRGKPIIIFSTYQSAHVVVEAQHKHGMARIDYAFMDEAHELVGKKKKTQLGELFKWRNDGIDRLLAGRRVYATATPVVASRRMMQHALKVGAQMPDSLDDQSLVFGPVAHRYSFRDGIADGYLVDYEVAIVAVPEKKWAQLIDGRVYLRQGNGELINASDAVAIEALTSLRDRGYTHMVTYHTRIAAAEEFADALTTSGLSAETVNGQQSAGTRNARIARIRDGAEPHILTNVNCLTQGIDIPTLHGVAFVDPLVSEVNIVQAIGRALRPHDTKQKALILIPIPIEQDDWDRAQDISLAEVAEVAGEGAYRKVWAIIQAIAQHDQLIAHQISMLKVAAGKRRIRADFDEGDGIPDIDKGDLEAFAERYAKGEDVEDSESPFPDHMRAPLLGSGKISIYTEGTDRETAKKFADFVRLEIIRESFRGGMTQREHAYNLLINGHGFSEEQVLTTFEAVERKSEAAAQGEAQS